MQTKFDIANFVIEFEAGNLDDDQIIEGFQHLIDNGMAWTLQGAYGRMAKSLIDNGLCQRKQDRCFTCNQPRCGVWADIDTDCDHCRGEIDG